ncbi:MAG TPA: hypothetical protein PKM21_17120 [Anaerolineales bacterium]|nr:hypothetical protein [Anaerolineales bacterium]
MSTSRRDFMKVFGAAVASLLVMRCQAIAPTPTCYVPMPPTSLPTIPPGSARERLRLCWRRFGELAQATVDGSNTQEGDAYQNPLGQQMITEHRAALDEMVVNGEISNQVAGLVHEAYEAAVFHVWRSNVMITCYEPVMVDYAPSSADVLVKQAELLNEIAGQGSIDAETLAKAQAALEHDMAFYQLSDEDVAALYDKILAEAQAQGQAIPSFEALEMEVSPEAQEAAQFIITLLTGK